MQLSVSQSNNLMLEHLNDCLTPVHRHSHSGHAGAAGGGGERRGERHERGGGMPGLGTHVGGGTLLPGPQAGVVMPCSCQTDREWNSESK